MLVQKELLSRLTETLEAELSTVREQLAEANRKISDQEQEPCVRKDERRAAVQAKMIYSGRLRAMRDKNKQLQFELTAAIQEGGVDLKTALETPLDKLEGADIPKTRELEAAPAELNDLFRGLVFLE